MCEYVLTFHANLLRLFFNNTLSSSVQTSRPLLTHRITELTRSMHIKEIYITSNAVLGNRPCLCRTVYAEAWLKEHV